MLNSMKYANYSRVTFVKQFYVGVDYLHPNGYKDEMLSLIQQTELFEKWHDSVEDLRA